MQRIRQRVCCLAVSMALVAGMTCVYTTQVPKAQAETGQKWEVDLVDVMEGRYYKDDSISSTSMAYMLYVPESYNPQKEYPVVMFLHGAGQKGSNFEHITQWGESRSQILYMLVNDPIYRENVIIYAPQCSSGDVWAADSWDTGIYDFASTPERTSAKLAMGCLQKEILDKYSVDTDRLYLAGYSMGAMGVWDYLARYPDTFAAAMPVSGLTDVKIADRYVDIPIWTSHAVNDVTVPPVGTQSMVKKLRELGGYIHYVEYETGGHGTIGVGTDDRCALDWMMSKRKGEAAPVVTPGSGDLFASDFSMGLEDWQQVKGTWSTADGQASAQEDALLMADLDTSWSQYAVECLVALPAEGEMGQAGVVARLQNGSSYYAMILAPEENRIYLRQYYDRDGKEVYDNLQFNYLELEPGETYALRLEAVGNRLTGYVKTADAEEYGYELLDYTDTGLGSYSTGIYTHYGDLMHAYPHLAGTAGIMVDGGASFTDFRVTKIDKETEAPAPCNLTVDDITGDVNGLSGLYALEYKLTDAEEYIQVPAGTTRLSGLEKGVYQFRVVPPAGAGYIGSVVYELEVAPRWETEVVIEEDFENGADRWNLYTDVLNKDQGWSAENGHLARKSRLGIVGATVKGSEGWHNYSMETDVILLESTYLGNADNQQASGYFRRGAGLVAGYQNPAGEEAYSNRNFYILTLSDNIDGKSTGLVFTKVLTREYKGKLNFTSFNLGYAVADVQVGTTYRLRMDVVGNTYICYLDGKALLTVTDTGFGGYTNSLEWNAGLYNKYPCYTGEAGVGSYQAKASFDNYKLTRLKETPSGTAPIAPTSITAEEGRLSGLQKGYTYELRAATGRNRDGGYAYGPWESIGEADLLGDMPNDNNGAGGYYIEGQDNRLYQLRVAADEARGLASGEILELDLRDEATTVPEGLTADPATGTIAGLNPKKIYEWKSARENDWTMVAGQSSVTGLSPDTYEVRYAGTATVKSSSSVLLFLDPDAQNGVIFEDSFSGDMTDTGKGWDRALDINDGCVLLANGKMLFLTGQEFFTGLTDYTYEAELTIDTESTSTLSLNASAIVARTTGQTNGYEFGLCIKKDGSTYLRLLNRANTKEPLGEHKIDLNRGVSYRMKMVLEGNRIRCYLNEEPIFDVTDDNFPSGSIGARVSGYSTYLDNVRVSQNIEKITDVLTTIDPIFLPVGGDHLAAMLPSQVMVRLESGKEAQADVQWDVSAVDVSKAGMYTAVGAVEGWVEPIHVTVTVVESGPVESDPTTTATTDSTTTTNATDTTNTADTTTTSDDTTKTSGPLQTEGNPSTGHGTGFLAVLGLLAAAAGLLTWAWSRKKS